MEEILRQSELLGALEDDSVERLAAVAHKKALREGEYLFLLGDHADSLYVVLSGRIEICMPLSFEGATKDISVETRKPGAALGWSSFVKPHRFTLSARAGEPTELAVLPRQELNRLFAGDAELGLAFMGRLCELVGHRLLAMQALWTRELQRSLSSNWANIVRDTSPS